MGTDSVGFVLSNYGKNKAFGYEGLALLSLKHCISPCYFFFLRLEKGSKRMSYNKESLKEEVHFGKSLFFSSFFFFFL